MKSLIPVSFIVVVLTAFCYNPIIPDNTSLTCTLSAGKTTYKIGELPVLNVEIVNNGKKDIYLIGSLDGSDVGWRMPVCYFKIEKPVPDTVRWSRCRNMNALRPADFVLVKKGGRFNPYQQIDGSGFFSSHTVRDTATFRKPGLYKIRFYYSTNTVEVSKFMGDPMPQPDKTKDQQLHKLLQQVPRVTIESNEIEIRFEQ